MARFLNHSCEPNCELRVSEVVCCSENRVRWTSSSLFYIWGNHSMPQTTLVRGEPRIMVVAVVGLAAGNELTIDYRLHGRPNTSDGNQGETCYCGVQSCRGTMGAVRRRSRTASVADFADDGPPRQRPRPERPRLTELSTSDKAAARAQAAAQRAERVSRRAEPSPASIAPQLQTDETAASDGVYLCARVMRRLRVLHALHPTVTDHALFLQLPRRYCSLHHQWHCHNKQWRRQ